MLVLEKPRTIRVMLTAFRDGLQSVFGGKVRVADVLPAMEAAAKSGIRHFEFGGGARFQAPLFYCGEDPFDCMRQMRGVAGPDAILQILTRSVSGVTLTTQTPNALALQGRLMKEYGTTWDRNFDFMNDVAMLEATGRPIVDAGMHHQACVALMGLPFKNDRVHTAEYYTDVARRILAMDCKVDSICLKDASGTTTPRVVYDAIKAIRALMPEGMPLWFHTHDTASTAVICNTAAIAGGADGIDLSVRPLASGTSQPDVRSMAHALKDTGATLDLDVNAMTEIETLLAEGLQDYDFDPVVLSADARVAGFPMPGGAIGPNVHMMKTAGILNRYDEVLAEFPVVVEAGGAWTSVTPGSQQYWLQAFNNVLHGRWKKIDPGYGKSVLGYFGKTPLPPDESVRKIAAEQLKLQPFEGNPLEAAPDNIEAAKTALRERGMEQNDRNTFLVLSSMTPGKKFEVNEGIRLLEGKPRIQLPLKKKDKPAPQKAAAPAQAAAPAASGPTGPVSTMCQVTEGASTRVFQVTLMPAGAMPAAMPAAGPAAQAPQSAAAGQVDVFSPFDGEVPVTDLKVRAGDKVNEGDVLAQVEAMKAANDVRSPVSGTISAVHVSIGDTVDGSEPILSITPAG